MNQDPAPSQTVALNLASAPNWFSDPTLTGTFLPGATFKLVIPCTTGLTVATTFRLAATNPDGGDEQPLGETTQVLGLCLSGNKTVTIPVNTPVALNNQRLKLTISSGVSLIVNLRTGRSTYLQATNYVGTP